MDCAHMHTQVLDYLDVSSNKLSGAANALSFPASLVFADLSNNELEGQLPGDASGWGNLQQLRLAHNAITGVKV